MDAYPNMDDSSAREAKADEQLLARMGKGDESAFATIYTRHALPLYRYAAARLRHAEDAEEIIQETFLKLWTKRESLGHVTKLKSYLYSTVRHAVLDHIAHSLVRNRYEQHFKLFEIKHDNSTQEQIDLADLHETLDNSISTLPEKCQVVFRMSRIENLSIQEIANRMELSTGTVENYITQALKHLRVNLKI